MTYDGERQTLPVHRLARLAAIAQRADYFDQAHLIGEFRQLAGRSPARYLRTLARPSASAR